MKAKNSLIWVWLVSFCVIFAWSAIAPFDRLTWVLEVAPAVAGAAVLTVTYKKFRFTPLAYWLA